jgi:hypothetical protein
MVRGTSNATGFCYEIKMIITEKCCFTVADLQSIDGATEAITKLEKIIKILVKVFEECCHLRLLTLSVSLSHYTGTYSGPLKFQL